MDAIVERCAGLDVHLDTVVACVSYGKLDIKPKKEVKKKVEKEEMQIKGINC